MDNNTNEQALQDNVTPVEDIVETADAPVEDLTNDNQAVEAVDENVDAQENATPTGKDKLKSLWGKIKEFFAKHENLRQMVMFILFSLVCFAVEKILFFALKYGLEKPCGETYIDWFIFHYNTAGNALNGFVAFIVSQVVAQACTFLLNRKKTFNATNNIIVAGSIYAVFAVGIVLFNVYLGGDVINIIKEKMGDNATAKAVTDIIGQALVSLSAFVLSFVCNKILALGGKKKEEAPADAEPALEPVAEVAADVADTADEQ